MIRKLSLNIMLGLILLVNSVFGISVVETTGTNTVQQDNVSIIGGITINWTVIVPIIIIGIIITIFLFIIMWIVTKIIKKIRASKKVKTDLEFAKYTLDLKNSNMNKNPRYKYKNWIWLFLLWKRAKIYARTSEGRKFVGSYDGELTKKEGYFIIAIELKHSFFKRETDLVLFPSNLKHDLVKFNDDGSIDLECEGIDEVLSSQYFSIPVFKDVSDDRKKRIFVDFSDDIRKNYFENYIYRDVLKENILEFATNVKEASEMNSSITYGRKTNTDLGNT